MIKVGEYNNLKVVRTPEFGYFLDAETGDTDDDVLLPSKSAQGKELNIGDEVEAFIYRDSEDRIIATLKTPLAKVGDIAYLKVASKTNFGHFIDFGLERDIFVPIKEQNYNIEVGKSYLFFIYLDKSSRIAATTFIERYLDYAVDYRIGDEISGIAYGFQTNGSVLVAVDGKYQAVILKNEYFTSIILGNELKLRIKKIYEDGKLGLTPRKAAVIERTELEEEILKYLMKHDGSMAFNDKSSPVDIKETFHESKNYFKNALGGLMRKGLVTQDENGTQLIDKK